VGADWSDRFAKPGDVDLILDIGGFTIGSWTQVEASFLIALAGGAGWWWRAGEVSGDVDGLAMDLAFDAAGSKVELMAFTAAVERWSCETVPLRLLSAPGRLPLLLATLDDWFPLPEGAHPPA
jgi:hypothetical protein